MVNITNNLVTSNLSTIPQNTPLVRTKGKVIPFSLEERVEKSIEDFLIKHSLRTNYHAEEELKLIILQGLNYNLKLHWSPVDNLDVVRTPQQFLVAMKLRSDVYREDFKGYDLTFQEDIKGLSYDDYDRFSPVFIYKNNNLNQITGTIRFIPSGKLIMPSEEYLNREKFGSNLIIAEMSKQAIRKDSRSNGVTFKSFYLNAYLLAQQLNFSHYIARIDISHFKLYEKMGGIKIENEIGISENVLKPSYIISWKLNEISNFFEKGFLKKMYAG